MEKKVNVKKILKIAINVLLYVFIAFCVVGIFFSISAKKSGDDATTIFGMQMRTVLSPSMEECDEFDASGYDIKDIPVNSVVFIKTVPTDKEKAYEFYKGLEVGDVLTFKYVYDRQVTITHRIIEKEEIDGGFIIKLQGDNRTDEQGGLVQTINTAIDSPNYVIGKVVGKSYALGLFLTALKSPIGIIFIVILPSIIVIILEVIKIVGLLNGDKKKKLKEDLSELEMLRQKLKEIEAEKENTETENSEPAEEITEN